MLSATETKNLRLDLLLGQEDWQLFHSSGVGNVPWQARSTSTRERRTTSNYYCIYEYLKKLCAWTGLPGTIHIPTIQVYSGYTQNHNSPSSLRRCSLHIHPSFPLVAIIIRAISINLWRITFSLAQMATFENRRCIWIKITGLFKFEWLVVLHVSHFFRWYSDIPLIHQKDCFQGACCWTKGLPKVFRTRANLSLCDH